ncbi:hypothetical protein IFM89_000520, partial [Coptis chinensis]
AENDQIPQATDQETSVITVREESLPLEKRTGCDSEAAALTISFTNRRTNSRVNEEPSVKNLAEKGVTDEKSLAENEATAEKILSEIEEELIAPAAISSSSSLLNPELSPVKKLADSEAEKILRYIGALSTAEEERPPDPEIIAPSRWADLTEDDELEEQNQNVESPMSDNREGQGHNTNCGLKPAVATITTPIHQSGSRSIWKEGELKNRHRLINKWDPDILGIAEPKINPQEMSMVFLQSHGLSTKFHHNSRQCQVPNLWLFWKSTISPPNLLHCSQQQLTVEVEGALITIIHAHCIYIQRRQLWTELQQIRTANIPWLLLGDFNAYLSDSEKQGGNKPSAVAMNDFRECVSNSHLMEVPSKGFLHTWWNKQDLLIFSAEGRKYPTLRRRGWLKDGGVQWIRRRDLELLLESSGLRFSEEWDTENNVEFTDLSSKFTTDMLFESREDLLN